MNTDLQQTSCELMSSSTHCHGSVFSVLSLAGELNALIGKVAAVGLQRKRAIELHRKINQLRSTIAHTEGQLHDALTKLADHDSFQPQSPSTSSGKGMTTSFGTQARLPPEQQQVLNEAQKILDQHIKQLGQYNQLKDIAMGMLGIIAEKQGKPLREVMEARGVEDDD